MSQRSYSPTQLAFRRLLRHRLAMVGLALLLLVVGFVLFGPILVDTDPSETRIWIEARPPGYTHPLCSSEMRFSVGESPRIPEALRDCTSLVFDMQDRHKVQLRVNLRRGVVDTITRNGRHIDAIDLSKIDERIYEELKGGASGRELQNVEIRKGEAPPEGLISDRVLVASWLERGERSTVGVTLDDGVVTGISETGNETQQLENINLEGQDVLKVTGDGEVLTLWHPFGTDELGRDLYLRVLKGGQVSLLVGLVATIVSLLIGVTYGAISGYVGGWLDGLMMRAVDVLYGLPFIFLVLLLMVVFSRNIILLFIALGMVQWLTMARIVRGQVLSLREREFIDAARMSGAGGPTVIFKHLIPHTFGPVIVYATLTVPVVILEESFLAFIGLPVQYQGTTLDSWGSLVNLGMSQLGDAGEKWWLLVFPSLAMCLTLFGLNCFGDGLRDSFDPKEGV